LRVQREPLQLDTALWLSYNGLNNLIELSAQRLYNKLMHSDQNLVHTSIPKDGPLMQWTVHLARQNPRQLAVLAISTMVASVAGLAVIGLLGSLAALLLMIASFADFVFPMSYQITRENVTCRKLFGFSEIKWIDVKRCYVDDYGVKLSPLTRLSKLEAFRGVYLRFDRNQEEVLETVRCLRESK
jgi:hypothetical protein